LDVDAIGRAGLTIPGGIPT